MARSRKDWAAVKAAYRRGEGSYREIGEKFGIPEQSIRKRAAREKWRAARDETTAKAEQIAVQREAESIGAMLARHRIGTSFVVKKLLRLAAGDVSPSMLVEIPAALASAIRQERLAAGIDPEKPADIAKTLDGDAEVVVLRRKPGEPLPATKAEGS